MDPPPARWPATAGSPIDYGAGCFVPGDAFSGPGGPGNRGVNPDGSGSFDGARISEGRETLGPPRDSRLLDCGLPRPAGLRSLLGRQGRTPTGRPGTFRARRPGGNSLLVLPRSGGRRHQGGSSAQGRFRPSCGRCKGISVFAGSPEDRGCVECTHYGCVSFEPPGDNSRESDAFSPTS